jgi:predicted aminopeptidase
VLNTFLSQDDVDVASTIIHELAHRRVWVKGDTAFNESCAAFVEQEGLRRYAEARQTAGGGALWHRYTALQAERERFLNLVMGARKRLMALYASSLSVEGKRARKAALIAELKADYQKQRAAFRLVNYDSWFAQPLNNAHLAGIAQYQSRQGAFRALFKREGRDFARFFAAVEAIGKLPQGERNARLDQLEAEGGREDHAPPASGARASG